METGVEGHESTAAEISRLLISNYLRKLGRSSSEFAASSQFKKHFIPKLLGYFEKFPNAHAILKNWAKLSHRCGNFVCTCSQPRASDSSRLAHI